MHHRGRYIVVGATVALSWLSFVHGGAAAWAQAGQSSGEPKRPAYQIGSAGRFNEDWSVLRGVDLDRTDDSWDRLKFIPLTPDQSVWLTLGGQVRERGSTSTNSSSAPRHPRSPMLTSCPGSG